MKKSVDAPCHSMLREVIEEEIAARGWNDPALVISELANTSRRNVDSLLTFANRLTRIECMMLEKTFGVSDGFFTRLQKGFERKYPEVAE